MSMQGVRGRGKHERESVMSIRTQRDIVFADARIGYNKGEGQIRVVPLKRDAYLPAVSAATPAPALVLAHGGAFHRGSKEDDRGGRPNTTTAEYCHRFAAPRCPLS